MTIVDIVSARKVITQLQQEKVPFALAYKFVKFMKETDTENDFYKDKLQDIMEAYGDKDEKGNYITVENGGIKIKDGYQEECVKKLNELENTEVTNVPSVTFDSSDFDKLELSIEDVNALYAFIK